MCACRSSGNMYSSIHVCVVEIKITSTRWYICARIGFHVKCFSRFSIFMKILIMILTNHHSRPSARRKVRSITATKGKSRTTS